MVDVLVRKTLEAAKDHKAKEVLVAGGVSANVPLRAAFEEQSKTPVRVPPIELCTDNAAMTAAVGHQRFGAGQRDALDMDVLPSWPLDQSPN